MHPPRPVPTANALQLDQAALDAQLVQRVVSGELSAFEALMRRHNRVVFRTVRSVIRSDAEAEDVAQDAWIAAYRHVAQFEGRASFATWVTKIAIRLALLRMRQRAKLESLDEEIGPLSMAVDDDERDDPMRALERRQLARLLERTIDQLPLEYRMVLVLRDVEQRSTTEVAESLGMSEENVRVRLHRSRAALRTLIQADLGDALHDVFAFDGERCQRMTAAVLSRLSRAS